MSDEKDLIKKRGSFKGRLTIFTNYLSTLSSKSLSSFDVKEMQLRMGKIESLYEQYDEVQLQLECLSENVDVQLSDRSEFESQYYKALANAQNLLDNFNKNNDELSVHSGSDKSSTRASNHKLVRLPTIQLPKFSGSYENWLEFHDTFTSLINSNDEIDEINKFHYLRASLEESAAVVIQSIEFSASNYTVAWRLLCDRYDNKRLLIQNHVSALFNLETITKESSVTLKRLIDQINKNLRTLESLGEPVRHWDTLLIYIVTNKLDQKTYREWEELKGRLEKNSVITFETFLQFLRNRADLIETLELSRNLSLNSTSKPNPKLKSMVSVQNSKGTDSTLICPTCKGDHNLMNCSQFLALSNDARLKLLPSYKVCFNCFRTGHFANRCKKPGCKVCKRRHNTLVHVAEPKPLNTHDENDNTPKAILPPPTPPPTGDADNLALSANVHGSCDQGQHDVLLSTALIKLCGNNNSEHVVRAVLDSGSTSCLMTEKLCRELKLATSQVDRSILGINNATSHVGTTCRVNMKSLNDTFSADLHCFVLPSITNNVPSRGINLSSLDIPSDICLADSTFYKPANVDILIGADLFWDLLGSQRIKLGSGMPVLCETRLGWIVSGPITSNHVGLLSNDIKCNFTKISSASYGEKDDIQPDLTRFWQLEEVSSKSSHYFPEEKPCEEHFERNTTRLKDGRFCVRIPLKQNPAVLGDSYHKAKQCLFSSKSAQKQLNLNIGCNQPDKLLGLGWHADSDELCFPMGSSIPDGQTKRDMLSVIAQIFDPLGLLAPCVITMKMLLQRLWLHKLSWDEPLTPEINKRWNEIVKSFPLLNNIRVPRLVICDSSKALELHNFTDASELAYGACVYVRSVNNTGEIAVRLLMAKSRVAPIKPTTIPRLELCGALVGARLYEKVVSSLRVKVNHTYFWTDSTIVLGWLQMLPYKLQPFVRNRIAENLEKTDNCTWKHVPTDKNPADLISRGVDISTLHNLDFWWFGPDFLNHDPLQWPSQPKHIIKLPEARPDVSLKIVINNDDKKDGFIDFSRFSNYLRLLRSVAYVLRFITSCRKHPVATKFLQEVELRNALNLIISKCQDDSFPEYKLFLNKQSLPAKSSLHKFNVFLDEDKILRVGGRLDNSNFSYNKKQPILLQSTHIFTKLLFEFEHKRLMHAGPQLLLASIRDTYWPIGGRNLAKACYHKCVRCSRMKGRIVAPLMGNLPQQRLLPGGYPFESVGVNYAGSVMSASRQGRGCRLVKVYIAIFICFTTKAIYLELVGDLTSNNYLLALRRFISRRGKPVNIYSDNGTSFAGAYNELSNFLKTNCNSLSDSLANDSIKFHFIPAYTPHFGGLWEVGVKSTKYHLERVLGNCHLTYEELSTTLTQIEAILNSRPLTPLSSDPADCTPLTPGHFLIGRPLTSFPLQDYQHHSTSHLTRFQRIEQLHQHFWARWSKEFVSELQQRVKWRSCKDGIKLDSLVVIKEDHMPPLKWKLGRLVAVHPGPDGIVRVADIRTSTGVIRRAFSKICTLPVSSE